MNNTVEIVVIGCIAYYIAGKIMSVSNYKLGIWFGKKGGRLLWLIVAILISSIYHWIKQFVV